MSKIHHLWLSFLLSLSGTRMNGQRKQGINASKSFVPVSLYQWKQRMSKECWNVFCFSLSLPVLWGTATYSHVWRKYAIRRSGAILQTDNDVEELAPIEASDLCNIGNTRSNYVETVGTWKSHQVMITTTYRGFYHIPSDWIATFLSMWRSKHKIGIALEYILPFRYHSSQTSSGGSCRKRGMAKWLGRLRVLDLEMPSYSPRGIANGIPMKATSRSWPSFYFGSVPTSLFFRKYRDAVDIVSRLTHS